MPRPAPPSPTDAVPRVGEQMTLFGGSAPPPAARPAPPETDRVARPAPPPAVSADPRAAPPWRHPQADREVVLCEARIAYRLRRAARRSIGFTIAPDGLVVAAPRWVAIGDIESGLRAKADWIVRKLHEQADRRRRLDGARIAWGDGATLPFLGRPLVLVLDPRVTGVRLDDAAATDAAQRPLGAVPHVALRVGLPQGAEPAQVRDAVQGWLQRQAIALFTERVAHYAQRLGVRPRTVRLSSAQTRWGSASADGTIRLNWRLVHFARETVDYVVAHECAHLRHMDHGPRFWDVVRSVVPDVEAARGALRDPVLPAMD